MHEGGHSEEGQEGEEESRVSVEEKGAGGGERAIGNRGEVATAGQPCDEEE